jgi:glycosyltransferase involved in cell wall biosynthesis
MNILFISPYLYPCHVGGVEVFNFHLIRALAKEHSVTVLSTCAGDIGGENISLIRVNPRRCLFQKPSLLVEHVRFILKFREKIDLVHVPYMSRSWPYGLYLPALRHFFGIPYVLVLHGGGMLPWKPRLPHRLLFRHAAAIVAVSRAIQEEYAVRSGRSIQVIPPLIPFRPAVRSKPEIRQSLGYREDDLIIMTLGSVKEIKGSGLLQQAFYSLGADVLEKHRARLLVVGDGPLRRSLEEEAKQRHFEKWVKFLGSVPHERVREMYRLADVYVIPSLMEGAPLSLMEAMFNGLPVIGSDIESIRLLIQDGQNGLLFKKGDSRALSQKLGALMSDPDLRERLGQAAGRTHDSGLHFEDVVNAHLRLYEEIVETHRNVQ